MQCLCNTGVKLFEEGKNVEELKPMVIRRELALVEAEDREVYNSLSEAFRIRFDECKVSKEDAKFYNALPEHAQVKVDEAKVTMANILHWILPDLHFRTCVREDYRDEDIETLRRWADEGDSDAKVTKEDVEAYLCFKKRIEKMEDEEFLQCLCNTGVKLYEKGKTVEELKLMVNKRELGFVEVEDREVYHALLEDLR